MYFSKFNYVAGCEKEQQKLLMNFLTRSADLIDPESADLFLGGMGKSELADEDKDYLLERGYAFSSEDDESQMLETLYDNELKSSAPIYAIHLDTFDATEPALLSRISQRITEMGKRTDEKPRPELVLYRAKPLSQSSAIRELEELVKHCVSLDLSIKLVTVQEALSFFQPLLAHGLVSDTFLACPLGGFTESNSLACDAERIVDSLVEHGNKVTIDVRLSGENVEHLKAMMNYFIYMGWPFLDNFECRLEPANNDACIFGHWYDSDMTLPQEIFQVLKAYPQTEFCDLGKWIGINTIHALIWKGRLPHPSFHFCNASKGLSVFCGDGSVLPCLRLAEMPRGDRKSDFSLEDMRQRNGKLLSDCQKCKYILSCGGGCSYQTFMRNHGRVHCPPIHSLIEAALEAYFDELLEKSRFIEQDQQGA